MHARERTARRAVDLFEQCTYPGGQSASTAWLGIYQVLLWYGPAGTQGALPHIIEADKLRAKTGAQQWVRRARRLEVYLARNLGCEPAEVANRVDLLMRLPGYVGLQRQNPLGMAFAELVAYVLRKFGDRKLLYRTGAPAREVFPAVHLQTRSRRPRIDVAAFRNGKPAAIITTKWSIRHDRLADVIDEGISYKSAAMRTGLKLRFFFVTNEFDPARLDKVLGSGVPDALVHVHPPAVTDVCQLDERLRNLRDLPFLVSDSSDW